MNSLVRGIKTIHQVGLLPVLQVGLYRLGLTTGHYRRMTGKDYKDDVDHLKWLEQGTSFERSAVAGFFQNHSKFEKECRENVEFILSGMCEIFGGQPVKIVDDTQNVSHHWTEFELKRIPLPVDDIKLVWEPARLGWVFAIARLAAFQKDPSLGTRSWALLEDFFRLNPTNFGPNWMNGQEVALRIFALVFFHEIFRNSSEMPENWKVILTQQVANHARRIPPTLVYARSQKNNHILVEAAGLYTAGVFLPSHPEAGYWRATGWKEFHQALNEQIDDDGTYAQYSTNYHRLMLQTALWMKSLAIRNGESFPDTSEKKLAAAANWLNGLIMPETGHVPNYGHNDGAYIFPLTGQAFDDYRPVAEAAERFFPTGRQEENTGSEEIPEMSLWFEWLADISDSKPDIKTVGLPIQSYRKLEIGRSKAILFAPNFNRRPGQADILHLELWADGMPLLLDPGTYRYNASGPWKNALACTRVHNTVTVFEEDQMQRAGLFLWLDWPRVIWDENKTTDNQMTAAHYGYSRFGVIHKRTVRSISEDTWQVWDEILPESPHGHQRPVDAYIHWLLPDLDWVITPTGLICQDKPGGYSISIKSMDTDLNDQIEYQMIKAGRLLYSNRNQDITEKDIFNLGWYSPFYGKKDPAVSFRAIVRNRSMIRFLTEIVV